MLNDTRLGCQIPRFPNYNDDLIDAHLSSLVHITNKLGNIYKYIRKYNSLWCIDVNLFIYALKEKN